MVATPPDRYGFTELRVVTSARWLAQDLTGAGILPVVHDLGLDAPLDVTTTAWWCPGQFAARLTATGIPTTFWGPPAAWQAQFPHWATRRTLVATTLGRVTDATRELNTTRGVFAKLADIKTPAVPAQWWSSVTEFTDTCTRAGLDGHTPILLTDTHLDLAEEYRHFVTHRQVTAGSIYRIGDTTWDAWDTGDQPHNPDAEKFASDVVAALDDQPAGWVLDVGLTTDREWVVIEANPSWCANPYHGDPHGTVPSILAGQTPHEHDRAWAWDPGDYLLQRARPLPRCTPLTR